MEQTVISTSTIAIIAGVQLVILAIVNAWVVALKEKRDARIRREEKEQDYARQDIVAQRVEASAARAEALGKLQLQAQKDAATAASADAKRIANHLIAIDEQGRKIHILVNSDMTAARVGERDSLKLLVLALRKGTIAPGSPDEEELIRVEKRIEELNQILADRHAAQLRVEAEQRAHEEAHPDVAR